MAHQTLATRWLYENRSKLSVQFLEKNWPMKYGLPYFDFEVIGTISDKKYIGRGVDKVRKTALEKACAEMLENFICLENELSSVGASLSSYELSERHAYNEFMERFYLNYHLDQNIPFTEINVKKYSLKEYFPDSLIKFYRFKCQGANFGIVCHVSDDLEKINSFGFSYSDTLEYGIEKSFVEALPNFIFLKENKSDSSNTDLPWQLTLEFYKKMNTLFNQAPQIPSFISVPDVFIQELKIPQILVELKFPFKVTKFLIREK